MICPYGSLTLTNSSPPQSFVEPLTLAEVKSFLKIPVRSPVDDAEDAELMALIAGSREQAEILQNRDLVLKRYDLVFDYWLGCRIELRAPLISVDLMQYRDSSGSYTQMTENTDFIVDTVKSPGVVLPAYGLAWPSFSPWPSSAILVRFTSGMASSSVFWGDAGARIKIGMLRLIADWYSNRLPFEKGADATAEYPFGVSSCLSHGAVPRSR